MKNKQPFLHWLLMMVTLGQYAFVWIFLLARDANQMAGEERIPIKKHALAFGIIWSTYFVGFIATALTPIETLAKSPLYVFDFTMVLALGLVGYFFWLLFAVAREFRLEQVQCIPSNRALFGYSLLYMSSLPLLQSKVNKRSNQVDNPRLRSVVSDF